MKLKGRNSNLSSGRDLGLSLQQGKGPLQRTQRNRAAPGMDEVQSHHNQMGTASDRQAAGSSCVLAGPLVEDPLEF